MKIYTKTGDAGTTGLFGGKRVSKADDRVAAYGDVDELNSAIGVALVHVDTSMRELLLAIQSELFDLGAELACDPDRQTASQAPLVSEQDVTRLERAIDEHEKELEPLRSFILPGGSAAAAHLHLARTICRRAERGVVDLGTRTPVRAELLRYLNRLSDLLFVLARAANARVKIEDVPWKGRERSSP
jgi:cob(I)alamin adenosyltransferase